MLETVITLILLPLAIGAVALSIAIIVGVAKAIKNR